MLYADVLSQLCLFILEESSLYTPHGRGIEFAKLVEAYRGRHAGDEYICFLVPELVEFQLMGGYFCFFSLLFFV